MVFNGIEFLLPIKPHLSVFNTIITVLLNAAPLFSFINVSRGKESCTNIPPLMLIVNVGNNIIRGCYWIRQDEFISFLCSLFSGIFSSGYILWYSYFASNKTIMKLILYILCQVVGEGCTIYLFLSEIIPLKTVGLIIIFISTLQYIAPAQNLVKAFKDKNDKLIPIVSTICGCLCSGGWFLFGLIIGDINCIIPNGLGLVSSGLTALTWLYIKGTKKKEEEDENGEELGETLNEEEQ